MFRCSAFEFGGSIRSTLDPQFPPRGNLISGGPKAAKRGVPGCFLTLHCRSQAVDSFKCDTKEDCKSRELLCSVKCHVGKASRAANLGVRMKAIRGVVVSQLAHPPAADHSGLLTEGQPL